ncbi:xanthine/uracil permease, partial [Clavulina sp. PMI_390]
MGWNDYVTRLNFAVADSWVGVWFKLDDGESMGRRTGAVFTTELRAGLTTFAAMAYIISVNASIISATGGTCICETTPDQCSTDAAYAACKEIVRRDLITSTAAASCIASFLMGAFANLPVGLAPGLGLNAYFTYSVVGVNGTGRISYREALAAVFLEGWLFFFMSIFGVRIWLARLIPRSLTLAVGAGIGLFIALIGLSPNGIGVVGGDYSNIVGLGGCPSEFADPAHPAFCLSHTLQSPQMWLGIFLGGIVTVLMMMYRVRGAIIIGIFLVSVCSWPRNSPVTVFPDTTAGNSSYDYFKQVVGFYPLRKVGAAVDFNYKNPRVWQALVTFLYVDLFDTTGTLYAMAKFSGVVDPVTKDFERSTVAYCVDALSISMGSLLGTSPVTAFIESATGISDGGKTGLTAISVSFFFFLSVFFSPIFASIPDYATGGALVICGCLMIRNVSDINWRYTGDAVPAFLTLIIIPFTYNIAYGLIAGLATFCILNGFAYLGDIMSGGEWVPPGYYTEREPWVFPQDGLLPGWLR